MATERTNDSLSNEVIRERWSAILAEHDELSYKPTNEGLELIAEAESYLVQKPFYAKWLNTAKHAGNTVLKSLESGCATYMIITSPAGLLED